MKNAFDLLMEAPESQITRARIAYKAIVQDKIVDALFAYDCAICEYGTSQPWSLEVMKFCENIKTIHENGERQAEFANLTGETKCKNIK